MRRRIGLCLRIAPCLVSALTAFWLLSSNPLAWPVLERSGAALMAALDREMAQALAPEHLNSALERAVAEGDAIRAATLLEIAEENDVALAPERLAAARALSGADEGLADSIVQCGRCANDISTCRTIRQISLCAVPVELSPIGDLTALGRAANAYLTDAPIDQLDVGLALVGIAATASLLTTAGSSAAVKLGTGVIRLARKLGSLTPGMRRTLVRAGDIRIDWAQLAPFLRREVAFEAVADPARLARLGDLAQDAGRLVTRTSAAQAVILFKHVESGDDLRRLAKVADVAEARTGRILALLGKGRVLRALKRFGTLASAVLSLIIGLVAQAGIWLLSRAGVFVARKLLR